MRRFPKLPCWIVVAVACTLSAAGTAQEPEEPRWKEVTVKGEVFYTMPNSVARELGIPREDIPDKENAAFRYYEALNALPEAPRGYGDPGGEQFDAALQSPWDPEQNEALYAWFRETAEARRLFKEASGMERCQLPLLAGDPGATSVAVIMLPTLSGFRELTRLTAIEGHLMEHRGKVKEALEAYLTAIRAGGHLGREPILIMGLVGLACQGIGNDGIQDCLARHDVPAEVLGWLAGELEVLEGALPERGAWIAVERAMGLQIARMPLDKLGGLDGGELDLPEQQRAFLSSRTFRILWPDRTIRRDFERFYDELEHMAQRPPWETAAALREVPDEEFIRQHVKDWNVLALMLLPALGDAQQEYIKAISNHHALRINVALRLYRAHHAGYPDALQALAPEYLKEVPLDPFSGEAFHYRREDEGWLLYSVGPDQDDDGGRKLDESRFAEDGDIAYRSEPTEEEQ